jgi:hypothetical protein
MFGHHVQGHQIEATIAKGQAIKVTARQVPQALVPLKRTHVRVAADGKACPGEKLFFFDFETRSQNLVSTSRI